LICQILDGCVSSSTSTSTVLSTSPMHLCSRFSVEVPFMQRCAENLATGGHLTFTVRETTSVEEELIPSLERARKDLSEFVQTRLAAGEWCPPLHCLDVNTIDSAAISTLSDWQCIAKRKLCFCYSTKSKHKAYTPLMLQPNSTKSVSMCGLRCPILSHFWRRVPGTSMHDS
jgi:hypothetical protein